MDTACAQERAGRNSTPSPSSSFTDNSAPVLGEDAARQEAWALTMAFRHEVPAAVSVSSAYKAAWVALARQQLEQAGYVLDRPQVLVVVDRNPKVQRLCLILAIPGGADWQVIGSTKVSTGTTGRQYYYITPTGIFPNSADRLGYRALGTKNENGIMGNGTTGMRVWDFGWQWAEKGWLPSRDKVQIRLEMHATDPVYLEQRLGHTASEGCIRIPSSLNVFIDRHGLLDTEYEQRATVDRRFAALLRKDRVVSPIAGLLLVVVDTAGLAMPPAAEALKNEAAPHRPIAHG
ncbi:L,D-transpeptidase [Acetobacter fabarum]|uniref:L,D-transpeptidase n=1 Tax=Acetobacter fabarum TaxID=483199 RepID=UPI0038CF50CD